MRDDQLLRRYLDSQSQYAFTQIVGRYLKLVYHTSLREVRDPDLAEDVTQAVFLVLAEKASALRKRPVLAGWLFQTSRLASLSALKQERRRRAATERLARETAMEQPGAPGNEPYRTEINEALASLSPSDRDAILLRFYEEQSFQEIAETLGMTEDAAQKRVSRALDRMRRRVARSGAAGSAAIAALLAAEAARGVPDGLSAISAPTAEAPAAAAAGPLANGVLRALRVAQWKLAAAIAVVGVVVVGTTYAVAVAPRGLPRAASIRQRDNPVSCRLRILDAGGLNVSRIDRAAPGGSSDARFRAALIAAGARTIADANIQLPLSGHVVLAEPAPLAGDITFAGSLDAAGRIQLRLNLKQTDPTSMGPPNIFSLGGTWILTPGQDKALGESYGDSRAQRHHYVVFATVISRAVAPPTSPAVSYSISFVDTQGVDEKAIGAAIPAGPGHDQQLLDALLARGARLAGNPTVVVAGDNIVEMQMNAAPWVATRIRLSGKPSASIANDMDINLNVAQQSNLATGSPDALANFHGTWTLTLGQTREVNEPQRTLPRQHVYLTFIKATRVKPSVDQAVMPTVLFTIVEPGSVDWRRIASTNSADPHGSRLAAILRQGGSAIGHISVNASPGSVSNASMKGSSTMLRIAQSCESFDRKTVRLSFTLDWNTTDQPTAQSSSRSSATLGNGQTVLVGYTAPNASRPLLVFATANWQ